MHKDTILDTETKEKQLDYDNKTMVEEIKCVSHAVLNNHISGVLVFLFPFWSQHCESQKLLKCQQSSKLLLATFQSKGCEPWTQIETFVCSVFGLGFHATVKYQILCKCFGFFFFLSKVADSWKVMQREKKIKADHEGWMQMYTDTGPSNTFTARSWFASLHSVFSLAHNHF